MNRTMALLAGLLVFASLSQAAWADVSVRGYTRRDGTYVQPHHRSNPNNSVDDNYSTRGNVNPYTGQEGTRPRSYERDSDRGLSGGSLYNYGSQRRERDSDSDGMNRNTGFGSGSGSLFDND